MTAKPPYVLPSMADVRAVEHNGLWAASTFAGGGGSSLGYRMAGYRVAWANEVVPEAAACYRANADPSTVVDGRDVRDVTGADILDALEGLAGTRELDLLDGSPPCVSFSTAGKRAKGWGRVSAHTDGTHQRSDDLIYEWLRLVVEVRPKVGLMENVVGLARGVARGHFIALWRGLRDAGYRVEARELDAQWLGVPQARRRVFLQAVRDDAPPLLRPAWPDPLPWRYSVRDACPAIVWQGDNGPFGKGRMRPADIPSPTIGAAPTTGNGYYAASRVRARPDGITIQRGPRAARVLAGADDPAPTVAASGLSNAREYQALVGSERRQLTLDELRALCGFPPDFALPGPRLEGWARLGNAVPPPVAAAVGAAIRDRVLDPWRLT